MLDFLILFGGGFVIGVLTYKLIQLQEEIRKDDMETLSDLIAIKINYANQRKNTNSEE